MSFFEQEVQVETRTESGFWTSLNFATAIPIPEIVQEFFEPAPCECGISSPPTHINLITGTRFYDDESHECAGYPC